MEVDNVQIDPDYEFDCPKYYDFSAASPGGSDVSAWFDNRRLTEGAQGVGKIVACRPRSQLTRPPHPPQASARP